MTEVAFHFDLMCPWAFEASTWIREASRHRDIGLTWRFFSLEEAAWQAGSKHPWERPWSFGWGLLRVAALLRREAGGNAAVARFYEVAGTMLHVEGLPVFTPEGAEGVLRRLDLDPRLVGAAIEDESTTDDVREEHGQAVARGIHGVPTLVIDDEQVLFGPVMTPAPTGEDAARLWDLVIGWTEFPHLYELQRPKLPADSRHIEASFDAYRVARGWSKGKRR